MNDKQIAVRPTTAALIDAKEGVKRGLKAHDLALEFSPLFPIGTVFGVEKFEDFRASSISIEELVNLHPNRSEWTPGQWIGEINKALSHSRMGADIALVKSIKRGVSWEVMTLGKAMCDPRLVVDVQKVFVRKARQIGQLRISLINSGTMTDSAAFLIGTAVDKLRDTFESTLVSLGQLDRTLTNVSVHCGYILPPTQETLALEE